MFRRLLSSFSICSLHPPTSLYVTSGLSSTCIIVTVGSIFRRKRNMNLIFVAVDANSHSLFDVSRGHSIGQIDDEFCELFDIYYILIASSFSALIILVHRATCRGCSFCSVCLSAAKSQSAGGARPVSDSLIPVNSLTRLRID